MSENQNRETVGFAKYQAMSTEELEQILRLDMEAPEGEPSDGELLLYVMEVLAERKRNAGQTGKTALEAFESFKQNYMPETEFAKSAAPVKTRKSARRWLRTLAATAAVVVFLLAGTVTAKAFGFHLWQTVVQWTQETFHFGQWGDSNPRNSLPYASLQEALEKGNIPVWFVPTWLPDGFELTDITVEQSPLKKVYTALYRTETRYLKITIRDYLNEDPVFVEQSEGFTEEYTASGITYYLFKNMEHSKGACLYESYECEISGEVTIEELKQMINSIQKG